MSNNKWKEELNEKISRYQLSSTAFREGAEWAKDWIESNLLKEASLPVEQDAVILGLEEGCEQWKSRCENAESIIRELVKLKNIKDKEGKTEYYTKNQPSVWKSAFNHLAYYNCEAYSEEAAKLLNEAWPLLNQKEENNISQLQEVSPASSEGNSIEDNIKAMIEDLKAEKAGLIVNSQELPIKEKEKGYYLGAITVCKDMIVKLSALLNQGSTPERSVARDDHRGDGDGNTINPKQK